MQWDQIKMQYFQVFYFMKINTNKQKSQITVWMYSTKIFLSHLDYEKKIILPRNFIITSMDLHVKDFLKSEECYFSWQFGAYGEQVHTNCPNNTLLKPEVIIIKTFVKSFNSIRDF